MEHPPARQRLRAEAVAQVRLVWSLLRWIVLGAISGVLAGLSSFVFLVGLDRMTDLRLEQPWLLWLLPVAGLGLGAVTQHLSGPAARGNALLLDEIHEPTTWIPRRMAPIVLGGTWITHLFGGSAGREGTALQLSGSLTDAFARVARITGADRRLLLVTALAGGFGAVFGVPLAGTVFALEVQTIGRARYDALVPALSAALVGDRVVAGLGHHHTARPPFTLDVDASQLARVAIAGLCFGVISIAFVELTHAIRSAAARWIRPLLLRPALGGVAVVGLALLFGRDYLGLSLPLIDRALGGEQLSVAVFALKLLFTAVTLGTGFPGGEVTPLFVIGTTAGAALAGPLGLPVPAVASLGFVGVFAGAANTPLACTIMSVELFGPAALLPAAVACVLSFVCSGHRGIYPVRHPVDG